MHIQESGEMYLETILILSEQLQHVRSIDVSEYMGFSRPSVSRGIGILKKSGYLNMDGLGYLTLTQKGLEIAKKIYARHKVVSEFLVDIGVPADIAAKDACKIEHHLSDESFEAIKRHMKKF